MEAGAQNGPQNGHIWGSPGARKSNEFTGVLELFGLSEGSILGPFWTPGFRNFSRILRKLKGRNELRPILKSLISDGLAGQFLYIDFISFFNRLHPPAGRAGRPSQFLYIDFIVDFRQFLFQTSYCTSPHGFPFTDEFRLSE